MRSIAALLLSISSTTALACDKVSETHEVAASIDEALEQYRQLEMEAFNQEVSNAETHLGCLKTFFSRHHAAEFHRLKGIQLFVGRNSPEAQKHFAAARVLEPNYSFPTDLVPEGNPLLDDYNALESAPPSFDALERPTLGTIKLDGSTTLNRGAGRPVIFQLADGTGVVTSSALVGSGAAVPAYESGPAEGGDTKDPKAGKPPKPVKDKSKKGGPSIPLLAVAGVAALAAGGMYGGALASKSSWKNVPANSGEIDKVNSARGLTNGLVVGSWVAGGVAVGVGTTAFVVNGRF